MNRNIKIIIFAMAIIIAIVGVAFALSSNKNNDKDGKLNIVTTTFSTYDFARQIAGDKANVTYLLGPGVDAHSYEPSAADLVKIQNADVFIYIGGEMESWTNKVFESNTLDISKTVVLKVTDIVDTIEEAEVDGAEAEDEEEEEGAFDEHIWTSPNNAIKMLEYLNKKFGELDSENKETYNKNTQKYIEEVKKVQAAIKKIVDNKKRDRLVFGDKMPMQYFLNEYGLKASAAFSGCSTETEPSAKTITYLVNKVREENIPVVLYIELSTGKTAKSIADETGTEALQIQTLHNISKDDFQKGETYVSLMERNLEILKKALQ
ncbi:MAG: zinc ABC transporter substrate-binding protein [Clostridia bacterium]|nr:zinc ABC transporter substrate-binding protein [Clostridia bacterium]